VRGFFFALYFPHFIRRYLQTTVWVNHKKSPHFWRLLVSLLFFVFQLLIL